MTGLIPVGVLLALVNRERLAKLSKGGFDRPIPFVVGGMAGCWLKVNGPVPPSRKWPSSNVDIGCVGYANGSSDGNIMGMRSGTLLLKLVNC